MCEIEISHMGKNNGNPDLVCEKTVFKISFEEVCNQIFSYMVM